MSDVPSIEDLHAFAAKGQAIQADVDKLTAPPIYEQDEIICALTLDQKQAWVLLTLLAPYKTAEPDNWDIYRAAWDVRRRIAEVMGYE